MGFVTSAIRESGENKHFSRFFLFVMRNHKIGDNFLSSFSGIGKKFFLLFFSSAHWMILTDEISIQLTPVGDWKAKETTDVEIRIKTLAQAKRFLWSKGNFPRFCASDCNVKWLIRRACKPWYAQHCKNTFANKIFRSQSVDRQIKTWRFPSHNSRWRLENKFFHFARSICGIFIEIWYFHRAGSEILLFVCSAGCWWKCLIRHKTGNWFMNSYHRLSPLKMLCCAVFNRFIQINGSVRRSGCYKWCFTRSHKNWDKLSALPCFARGTRVLVVSKA